MIENIIKKCKEEPTMFYKFINGKLKTKEEISKVKVEGIIYEGAYSQMEIINKSCQLVFTRESSFIVMRDNRKSSSRENKKGYH